MKKEQDHKKLGRKLGLFSFSNKVPGVVSWWPKGTLLYEGVVGDLEDRLVEQGYSKVKTPTIISIDTLSKSGHMDNYREKLFFTGNESEMKKDKVRWCLKPMNCPGSINIFNQGMRSYKELPLKYSEVGQVYRYEQAGEVNGLLRGRVFTQDDAHIYCSEDQIEAELIKLIKFIQKMYRRYDFKDISVELSTRPKKSIGTDEQWEKAEQGLRTALTEVKLKHQLNEGDGAFYGPKIDFHLKDALNRSWQMGTVQLDFSMAERLEANYIDQKGKKQNPIIIHRAILGSVERFIAILLEQSNGALAYWLSPIQVQILPVSEGFKEYADQVADELRSKEIRVEVNNGDQTLNRQIKEGEEQKIPYLLVVGGKEEKAKKVAVRDREKGDLGQMSLADFIKQAK